MSDANQLTLTLDKPHRNEYLFSDHYLEERLRRTDAWTAAQTPAAEFLAWLRGHYAAERDQLANYNEAQLEENWIKPILGRLGHVWEPQATIPGMDGSIKKPDYVFFPDEAARKAAVSDQRTEEYARFALAAGEVKAWPVNLSRKAAGAPVFDNNNPMFQIDYYLKAGGVSWGIVSNGRFWRLVHKDSSYRLDRYFEIDLREALTTPDERRALAVATYFTLFFGRAAFAPDDIGRVFLNDVLTGSNTYAVALESDLRDNAYKALEQLIAGFFAPTANGLNPQDEADRVAVYRNSLLLLYRLLFLFYGESRGLLPMGNERYRLISLTELAKQAARKVDDHKVDELSPMRKVYWTQFNELFTIIDGRDAGHNAFLGVPRYNGGLFDPARHAFLETKVVGERHLVRAIDYLARRRKTENGRFTGYESVDYRTLGVRQLGSIYEGLLEYKVSVAAEAMVTVRKGGKETWLPARERGKAKVIETRQPGELYLATDKGERKATGSYYTPDYIVKYIVEQTLGPLVEEARERVTSDELRVTSEEGRAARFEKEILSLNVLDPAMGSGHFLVEATNFLARALATADLATSDELRVSSEDESDLTYWKRRVVEACIYGVDKNELAVELAKLSLWLETVAADKPLSFLDHHLRHGDSLIGARLADLEVAPGAKGGKGEGGKGRKGAGEQEPLFDESAFTTNVGQAVGGMAAIEARPTDDLDAVHAKEDAWHIIRDTHLGRWRQLADLWTSTYFGNDMSAEEYRDLARRIQGQPGGLMSDEQAARYLNHPAAVANDYFHWELEFPEVFFDQYGRPKGDRAGFDAVVGNPPYGILFSEAPKRFLEYSYSSFIRNNDLYAAFSERATQLTRNKGFASLIIPNTFIMGPYFDGLKRVLLEDGWVKSIVDFGFLLLFPDPDVFCAIFLWENGKDDDNKKTELRQAVVEDGQIKIEWADIEQLESLPISRWKPFHPITKKAMKDSLLLGDMCYVKDVGFNYWTTGREKKRGDSIGSIVLYEGKQQHLEDIPFIKGSDFSRYSTPRNPTHWLRHNYLSLLDQNNDTFRFSAEFLQVPEKIIYRQTADNLVVTIDDQRWLVDKTVHIVLLNEKHSEYKHLYLVALMNSSLMRFIYEDLAKEEGRAFAQVKTFRVKQLPIHQVAFNLSEQHLTNDKMIARLMHPSVELDNILDKGLTTSHEARHYTAYEILVLLAEQMIAMHKEKQTLTAGFWTDLEGATAPAAFHKLRDKGKQEASLAKDPALAAFVNPDSKSGRTLDEALAWDEAAFKAFIRALAGPVDGLSRLVKVYHDHTPRYRDLTERIARTDWLIDRIVYKLYGLTDDEIAIVEGR